MAKKAMGKKDKFMGAHLGKKAESGAGMKKLGSRGKK